MTTVPTHPPSGPAGTAERFATHLAVPELPSTDAPWMAQSLAQGAAGIALLNIERAHTGHGTWRQAHTWITNAVAGEISAADTAGLYLGAPAIAFVLHAATSGSSTRYHDALKKMDTHVSELAHRRVAAAMARIDRGDLPQFGEYDIFYGLTGIGAYLLRSAPGSSALEQVLRYLVTLAKPLRVDGQNLPGWWVAHDPHGRLSSRCPGGHGNLGAAHGITGPLLFLSQALRRGISVDGQREAIAVICAWLDTWKQTSEAGPWWPQWVTRADLHTGKPSLPGPARPSWCYGAPGVTRAGQLAGIATGDLIRQQVHEDALSRCLADPTQLRRITSTGLCHGWAGVYQTVWRAARDATTPALRAHLPHLADTLVRRAAPGTGDGPGFLDGDAGTALTLHTAAQGTAPTSGWDACLLID